MKVLNLQCAAHHVFEGWFASEDDFASQRERGLLECPLCSDKAVHKLPTAPRLNLGGSRAEPAEPPAPAARQEVMNDASPEQSPQAAWMQLARRIVAQTEDVGERFAEEARKIHYGESQERAIRGQATRKEAEALLDEGISVVPLPLPEALKGTVQ